MTNNRNFILPPAVVVLLGLALSSSAEEMREPTISSNIGIASDYISRGLRLNWGVPPLQASVDVMHGSGVYVGASGSQVTDNFYANGAVEFDLYAGHRGQIGDTHGYDIGLAAYLYPSANYKEAAPKGSYPDKAYDTTEAVIGITRDWLNLKYSYCLTDYFGYDSNTAPISAWNSGVVGGVAAGKGTRGSGYLEANASFDLGDSYTLALHAARQHVANSQNLSYNDYKLSISKGYAGGISGSLAVTNTQGADIYKNFLSVSGNGKTMDIGGTRLLISLNKTL